MRKSFFFLVLFMAAVVVVRCETLQIRVVDRNAEPLAYSYVYLNGKAMAITDTLGTVWLDRKLLHRGDTLSVPSLGSIPVQLIYTPESVKDTVYEIALSDVLPGITSDEVVVRTDLEKFYNKCVRKRAPYFYTCILEADFYYLSEMLERNAEITGRLRTGNLNTPTNGYFDLPARFVTAQDTTGWQNMLQRDIRAALVTVCMGLEVARMNSYNGKKPVFGYLGKREGMRIFRISYPDITPGTAYQLLLEVDERTRLIRTVTVDMADTQRQAVTRAKARLTSSSYDPLKQIPAFYIPSEISYTRTLADECTTEIELTAVDIRHRIWNRKKRAQYTDFR